MKPDKVLCCILLLTFFGLDRAQNTIVVYSVTEERRTYQCKRFGYVIHAKCLSKIVHGRGPSNINLEIFVCSLLSAVLVPSINYVSEKLVMWSSFPCLQ